VVQGVIRPDILVFRPGALGDTIVTADALAAIRAHYPEATLELVGNAPAAVLLRDSGLVHVVTPFYAAEVMALFAAEPVVAERWRDAELVVLWLTNCEGIAAAFRRAGARAVVPATPPRPDRGPQGRRGGRPRHISDFLVESLREAGISSKRSAPTLLTQPRLAPAIPEKTTILHAGSGSPTRNWPAEHFAAIGQRLAARGWGVRLLRGPADSDAVSAVIRTTGAAGWPIDEPSDLTALASLLTAAALYVGNDSGVSHLSARLSRPTVALFGPTDPATWAPRGPNVAVLGGAGRWPSEEQAWKAIGRFIEP